MKYYVVHVSNGNLQIQSITEHGTPEAALVEYHNRCEALWSEPSVIKATVKILDEQLDCYNNHVEVITHAQAEAETPAEPEAETPAEPEAETPAEPEAETPAEPEAETPAEPEAETPAEPEAETPAES